MNKLRTQSWTLLSILALLFGAAWTWYSAVDTASAEQLAVPRQGFLAPDFNLQTSEGETIRLSDLRGRPVIVNIWASWCVPCRAEMPALQQVYEEYKDEGFTVLAVNATAQDNPADAVAFAQEYGLTFPILLDTEGRVVSQYQVSAFPSSYFIGPDGKIREVIIGGPMSEALLSIRAQELFE